MGYIDYIDLRGAGVGGYLLKVALSTLLLNLSRCDSFASIAALVYAGDHLGGTQIHITRMYGTCKIAN